MPQPLFSPLGRVPGVYRQDAAGQAAPVLATGVPAFVGFVDGAAPVGPLLLLQKADLDIVTPGWLRDASDGFFDNGGSRCYAIGVPRAATAEASATALIDALALAAPLPDVDLVAVPDAAALLQADGSLDEDQFIRVQRALILHCDLHPGRLALLDALRGKDASALVDAQLRRLAPGRNGPVNAALYHPWLRTVTSGARPIPPCGPVAGAIARTDARDGVFRAPANIEILGATALEADLDSQSLARLNEAGVNCLRAFPARGIRIWGARTLSSAGDWRFLNVRRLVLTLLRWIELNMAWASFEPHTPALWTRVQRELDNHLVGLWRRGALQGDTPEEAFYVRCNAEINPPPVRDAGQLITEIGLAAAAPAEFIVVSVQHRAGRTELL